MDPSGFVAWIVVAILLAAFAEVLLQLEDRGNLLHDLLYAIPASFLGTFMGSESFKDNWGFIGSQEGASIGQFNILTAIIFGAFVVFFAALAARSTVAEEEVQL